MALAAGTRLGTYEITGRLGIGGMGEVYRATDTSLDREVAIKVLPDAVVADADRVARFEREAKTLAALNHPNIAQIYGLERSHGATALVIELVEGHTLADRIALGAIPAKEALGIAVQIADALEAAHARGIVHRDLKPANINLRPDGTVKVLDFGVAKVLEARQTASLQPETSSASTPPMTEMGTLLGTAAYMSPEQARGKAVDERTDIWAFGCVLYEMLTGQPAFGGGDLPSTLARVLERDAPLKSLPAGIAPSIKQTIDLCLRKDIGERIADIRDVKLALKGAFAPPLERPPARRRLWVAAAAATALAVAALVAAFYPSPPSQEARPLRLSMSLPAGWRLATSSNLGEPTPFVVSPDGRRLAIVARQADETTTILMRELDAPSAMPLPGTENATSLFWSPDSQSIGFFADGKIKTIGVSGGAPSVVCDATAPFLGGTWGGDDTIVFSMPEEGTFRFRLWKVPARGGRPTHVLPDAAEPSGINNVETRPWFLPDGRSLLYVEGILGKTEAVYAARLDSPDTTKITEIGSSNIQYAQGHLLFLRGTTLVAEPFDAKRLALTGDPVTIAERVSRHGANPGYGLFSASQSGLLAYYADAEAGTATRLAWVDRQGQLIQTVGESADYRGIALSHDETRVVSVVGATSDLFVTNLSTGVSTQFSFGRLASFPLWSPDDRVIVFDGVSKGLPFGYRKPADGAGASTRILPDDVGPNVPFDQSPDGALLYVRPAKRGGVDLWVLPSGGDATPFRLSTTPGDKRLAKFSPDGRWVAYVSYDGGVQSVWVVPFVNHAGTSGARWRVSGSNGGSLPLWSPDGRELYYVSASNVLTAVEVGTKGQAFQNGASRSLFPIEGAQLQGGYVAWPYAVAKDGQRFLVMLSGGRSATGPDSELVRIEVDWTARLDR